MLEPAGTRASRPAASALPTEEKLLEDLGGIASCPTRPVRIGESPDLHASGGAAHPFGHRPVAVRQEMECLREPRIPGIDPGVIAAPAPQIPGQILFWDRIARVVVEEQETVRPVELLPVNGRTQTLKPRMNRLQTVNGTRKRMARFLPICPSRTAAPSADRKKPIAKYRGAGFTARIPSQKIVKRIQLQNRSCECVQCCFP